MKYRLYLVYLIQIVGLFLFCRGFFPHKKAVLHGYAAPSAEDVSALFDRLVFVVIDAWRSDFAFGEDSDMPKLQRHISSGVAKAFTARASTPTVTLPRLKCLTTGAITGFLDAILNIAESDSSSTVAAQDSWIGQMQQDGRRLHMYGDDTWLRLFPNVFHTSEGTSSFFVSDYTEVDNNVTRHLDQAFSAPVWDTLILHYLGLDHIGHLEGPKSIHMPEKQREMDDILDKLYQDSKKLDELDGKKTLLIALGDHGMTGDGNHGGASEPEIYTAVTMLSKVFTISDPESTFDSSISNNPFIFHDQILQSDIVPALAMMLGIAIPQNSLGIVPHAILHSWSSTQDRGKALAQNAKQLQKLLRAAQVDDIPVESTRDCFKDNKLEDCSLQALSFEFDNESTIQEEEWYRQMKEMQDVLLSSSNDYNMWDIQLGLFLLLLATLVNIYQVLQINAGTGSQLVLLMPILHAASAFASSFIEEEQVIWYYFTAFGLLLLFSLDVRRAQIRSVFGLILGLISFRLVRRFNQTGQKFSGASDVATLLQHVPRWEILMVVSTISILGFRAVKSQRLSIIAKLLLSSASMCLFGVKYWVETSTLCTRLIWVFIALTIFYAYLTGKKTNQVVGLSVSIIFALQSRPHNYPVLLLFDSIDKRLRQSSSIPWTVAVYFALQQASFFALGNSNSLAGLDLSQAYNGVTEYNEVLVGLLLFLSTFIGPVYWQASSVRWLNEHAQRAKARTFAKQYMAYASGIYAFALCSSCYILRHHLFVFSVFSPKLLFTAAWTLFYALALVLT